MVALHQRTSILLVMATLGALGMFFGSDDWFGFDLGPVGAVVLYVAFAIFAVHLARSPEAVFSQDASPAERQGWVGIVFISLVSIHFTKFLLTLPALGARADDLANPTSIRFGIQFVVLLIAWGVIRGIVRSGIGEGVELDERDVRIQHFATRRANDAVCMLVVACVVALAMYPDALRPWLRPLIVANALVGLLVANSLFEHMLLVMRYRRARS